MSAQLRDGQVPRGRAADDGDDAERRCIATRASLPRERLVRFVIGPDGEVVPDIEGRLPGRGLWVAADRQALMRACRANLFAKVARTAAKVPADLAEQVERRLAERALATLGLARRAGLAVVGFEEVRDRLRHGRVAVLLSAADGAPGGKDKLRALSRGLPVVEVLTGLEIGAMFGRGFVVHAALGSGGLAARLLTDAGRLVGFRAAGRSSEDA